MHKHKKSSNQFLIIGVIIIGILSVVLINLENQPTDDVLVEVTPVQTTPKPTPVVTTPAKEYTNTRLNYSITIPAGAQVAIQEDGTRKTVATLPADAREVHITSGGKTLSISDISYSLTGSPRTQGLTLVDGYSYRTVQTPSKSAIYVREGLIIYYENEAPKTLLASLKIK